jgi:Escherichia/Staphylococcus phage prohead protease
MLAQHAAFAIDAQSLMPLGVWTEIAEDAKGLRVEGKLADTPRGREAHALLTMKPRPALDGLSIGFRVKKFTLGTKPNEPRRTIEKIDLLEISLVSFPANPLARVSAVKALHECDNIRDFEGLLRDGLPPLSSREAKKVARHWWGEWSALQRDDSSEELADVFAELKRINTLFRS